MQNDMSEETIQHQMQETRASLTDKLETLEQKVVGTVENASSAVNDTVDAIKETVHDTVATVQEGVKGGVDSVKDLFDVPAHVQRRPWLMMGGSVAVGYCLGALLTRSSQASTALPQASRSSWTPDIGVPRQDPANGVTAASAPGEPSIWAPEVAKLKGLALGVLFGTARELLVSAMPEQMGAQVKEVMDNVTKKAGGEPLPSADWDKLREPMPLPDELDDDETAASQQPRMEKSNGHSAARRW